MEAAANILQSHRLAPATRATRSSQMRAFDQFCHEMGVVSCPPSGEDMKRFAAWLLLYRCQKESSLRQYLAAVRTHFHQLNMHVPSPGEYGPLQAVVEGAKRVFSGPVRRSRPVTIAILTNLVQTVAPPGASWRQRMTLRILKDTCLVLYFSMLRSSSLFPPWTAASDTHRNLVWSRVKFTEDGATLFITLAKTNQHFRRVHQVVLKEKVGSCFCPVAALRRLKNMKNRPTTPDEFVFQLPTGQSAAGPWKTMVKSTFVSWFRGRLAQMGLEPEKFSAHSFRHGSVSLAIAEEPNLALVRLATDHNSDAIWAYAQVEAAKRRSVSAAMLEAVHHAAQQLR